MVGHYTPAQRSAVRWPGTIVSAVTVYVLLHAFETEIGANKCPSRTLEATQALTAVRLALKTRYTIRQDREVESLPLS